MTALGLGVKKFGLTHSGNHPTVALVNKLRPGAALPRLCRDAGRSRQTPVTAQIHGHVRVTGLLQRLGHPGRNPVAKKPG